MRNSKVYHARDCPAIQRSMIMPSLSTSINKLKVQINKDPICCRAEPDSKSVKHPVRAYMVSVFYLIIFLRLTQIQYPDYKLINPYGD